MAKEVAEDEGGGISWHYIPPYSVLPMPVNENCEGPITDGTHTKVIWEVWDACNCTVSMHDDQQAAIEAAARYNASDPSP